ncbi:YceD family protein [Marinicellulosiphila megalodicopiae]|uniref:YceD family protein n=1 Tax=Marinicellulosiphila megalodicopiae TaxID=2724896 RepID=UPI003BB08E85
MLNTMLPRYVEPYKLADLQGSLSGELAQSWFERACPELLVSVKHAQATLDFFRDEDNRRVVRGKAQLEGEQVCQRCLQAMPVNIDIEFMYAICLHEEMAAGLPEYLDGWIVTPDEKIDVLPIVEDEIILAISEFAMHDSGECKIKTEFLDESSAVVEESSQKVNPFSVLGSLKDQLKSGDS